METNMITKKECDIDNILLQDEKVGAKKIDKKKMIIIGMLIFAMILSIFVAPYVVNKLHIIDKAEMTLDDKKDTVVAVTTTAATISVAVAAMPGDSTTPLANQIAELDTFFIIVLIAIYLLKVLLVISTSATFKVLFPVACMLFIVHNVFNREYIRNLAIKILIFGLVIFLTVPMSVGIMNTVDTSLKTQEKFESVAVEDTTEEVTEKGKEDKNWWNNFWDDVSDTVVSTTKEMYQKAKDKFSELVDIVASLVITCCVIPLAVIVFLTWILKVLFGINISTKKIYGNMHSRISKAITPKAKNTNNAEKA